MFQRQNRVSGGPQVLSIVKSQIVQTGSGRPLGRRPAGSGHGATRTHWLARRQPARDTGWAAAGRAGSGVQLLKEQAAALPVSSETRGQALGVRAAELGRAAGL